MFIKHSKSYEKQYTEILDKLLNDDCLDGIKKTIEK